LEFAPNTHSGAQNEIAPLSHGYAVHQERQPKVKRMCQQMRLSDAMRQKLTLTIELTTVAISIAQLSIWMHQFLFLRGALAIAINRDGP
jgi:hypothetical protein